MSDSLISLGLAQQLEFAFKRNGWTSDEIHKLCKDDTLSRAKVVLIPSESLEQKDEMTLVSSVEMARLRAIQLRYIDLCEKVEMTPLLEFLDEDIDEVFTKEHISSLGFNPRNAAAIRHRLRNETVRSSETDSWEKVRTLRHLVRMTESELLRCLYLGRLTVDIIKKVLEVRGLRLGMKVLLKKKVD